MAHKLEMSPEAQALLTYLGENKPKTFTYDQAANITGVNDMTRLRGFIYTAIRHLKAKKLWYKSVRGVGYRLLPETEKNTVQTKRLDTIAKGTRKVDKDQDAISVSVLNRDAKLEFTFNSARIGRMLTASSRQTAREIKREIANGKLPIDE